MSQFCLTCLLKQHYGEPLCANCSPKASVEQGFLSFAPELCHSNDGYQEEDFAKLYRLEDRHFWFQYRNRLLCWALEHFCHLAPKSKMLEIGCGTGVVLKSIQHRFPKTQLFGSELSTTGLTFAARRLPGIPLFQMDARDIPFRDAFDVIGAFDVIEHIQEDTLVLEQIHQALTSKGKLLVSVPQHSWLWSEVDVHACHVRRYSEADLLDKLRHTGFHCLHSTSFVSILLPAMLLSRLKQQQSTNQSELEIPNWLNQTFTHCLNLEWFWVKRRFNLPIGGSRLIVAEKID